MFGLRMLQGRHLSVMNARTEEDFRNEVVGFAHSHGFKTITAMVAVDHSRTHTEFHSFDNLPTAYQAFNNDRDVSRIDPVMQHCKSKSIPIIWDQTTYVNAQRGELWEHQARFGCKSGIALAMHLPDGHHFLIGMDLDRALPRNPKTLTRVVADLQLFAVHAHEAALHVLVPNKPCEPFPYSLTRREVEALRLTMDGKTAWDVGEALNISERTAVFHLQNAVRKLKCVNKHQAVLKAIRLGILTCI